MTSDIIDMVWYAPTKNPDKTYHFIWIMRNKTCWIPSVDMTTGQFVLEQVFDVRDSVIEKSTRGL